MCIKYIFLISFHSSFSFAREHELPQKKKYTQLLRWKPFNYLGEKKIWQQIARIRACIVNVYVKLKRVCMGMTHLSPTYYICTISERHTNIFFLFDFSIKTAKFSKKNHLKLYQNENIEKNIDIFSTNSI